MKESTERTHYVPSFTTRGWPRAVCGASLRFIGAHSTEPSCSRCMDWLQAGPADLDQLERTWWADDRDALAQQMRSQ